MTRLTVQLPDSVSRKAERMAANDGITLEQLVAAAVAEKVSAVESTSEVLRRAARADEKAVRRVLAKVPAGIPLSFGTGCHGRERAERTRRACPP